ncbi:MAG: hypothetical protein J1E81_07480 [Eubacterium sp.]|nr:hypothetical protein [Eubacterium sp.]
MELKEAIEVQQHLINSYTAGKKINLLGMGDLMNAQYQKYVESCTIAITLMTAAEQNTNSINDKVISSIVDNRLYAKRLKEAEVAGNTQEIKNLTALKSVADLHKITFTEMCNIINELAALQEGAQI